MNVNEKFIKNWKLWRIFGSLLEKLKVFDFLTEILRNLRFLNNFVNFNQSFQDFSSIFEDFEWKFALKVQKLY